MLKGKLKISLKLGLKHLTIKQSNTPWTNLKAFGILKQPWVCLRQSMKSFWTQKGMILPKLRIQVVSCTMVLICWNLLWPNPLLNLRKIRTTGIRTMCILTKLNCHSGTGKIPANQQKTLKMVALQQLVFIQQVQVSQSLRRVWKTILSILNKTLRLI